MSDLRTLGIDTSNYTCSTAVYNAADSSIVQAKQLLPVKAGEKGIRQSDAVFHHTSLLPQMFERLNGAARDVCAVGVSDRPSCREGSYMPCFLAGVSAASAISSVTGVQVFRTTHQIGHILAALYSAKKLEWIAQRQSFYAFHVSGGTTDMLLCEPCGGDELIKITRVGGSSDLKAGQAIDRCGVMLGLRFPCGAELEKLAVQSEEKIRVKPVIKGCECSLSGIENKCRALSESGADSSYIAAFCLRSVESAVAAVTRAAIAEHGELPVLYAGGVMSDKLIADSLRKKFGADFAAPEFSCDNAAGMALYAALMKGLI